MEKHDLFGLVDREEKKLKEMASSIWEHPEPGYGEKRSSGLQKDLLSGSGFRVRDVPNVATGFVAEYGSGHPIVGILGEYDALPGLSQKISATREPYDESGLGHGCGHNLLGTGGVGAALAIRHAIDAEAIKGTIRYYGCPAEELLSGKVAMAKERVFDDLDSCVTWHPASMNAVWGCSFLAMNSMKFRFKGVPAHAAAAPQAGRSALDAVELMNVGANYLREHVMEKARIHYIITNGGMAPNIVPEDAEVWYYIRAPKRSEVRDIAARLVKVAQGAALMTETTMSMELVAGCYDVVSNSVLSGVMSRNLLEAGSPAFTDADRSFARQLSALSTRDDKAKVMSTYFAPDRVLDMTLCEEVIELDDRQKVIAGSTDVGDVSYIAPLAQITAATWPVGTAAHTWIATAASGSGIGLNAMIFASKVMAGTVYDLLRDPSLIASAREEHKKTLGAFKYISPQDE